MGAARRDRLRTKTAINDPNGQRCVRTAPAPRVPAPPARPDQRNGHLTKMPPHVADHDAGIRARGVQAGVGVVFGDAPQAPVLVPERGPGRVLTQEAGDPGGIFRAGPASRRHLPGPLCHTEVFSATFT